MRNVLHLICLAVLPATLAFAQANPAAPLRPAEERPPTTTVVIDPGPPPQAPVLQEALIALKSGKPEDALKEAEAALATQPDQPNASEIKARALIAMGKYPEAQAVLFKLLEKHSGHHTAHYYLGEAAFRERNFGPALQYYGVYSDLDKENGQVRLKMVYCLVGMQQPVPASKIANTLNPNDEVEPFYPLARAAIARAGGDDARYQEWIQVARTNYSNARINEFLPDLLFVLQNLEQREAEETAKP